MNQDEAKRKFYYVADRGRLFWRGNKRGEFPKNIVGGTFQGKLVASINRKRVPLANLVWIYHNGAIPPNFSVYHKDSNPLDVSIENLGIATEFVDMALRIEEGGAYRVMIDGQDKGTVPNVDGLARVIRFVLEKRAYNP